MNLSRGMQVSLGVHLILLLLVAFGLPAFFDAKRDAEPVVISVEILPIRDIDNIKPASSKAPAPKIEEAKEQPKPAEKPQEAPTPPTPTPPTKSAPPPPEPSPRELVSPDAPKEDKKKEPEKPKDEPKPVKKEEPKKEKEKPQEDDLAAILKSVATAAKKDAPQTPPTQKPAEKQAAPANETQAKPNNSTKYDDSMPVSMTEVSAIMSQIQRCWNIPAGARDAQSLVVVLDVKLNQDGSLVSVSLAENHARYASDSFYKAATDSAIRAVKRCTPLQGLPMEKYGSWQEMKMYFDPSKALF